MTNVLVLGIVGAFIILIIAAYIQSKKTREELIAEMKDEVAPVVAPAPVVAKVKEVVKPAPVEEVKPATVEAPKQEVKEMIASQEAPVEKPKAKRKRPAKKKPTQN